MDEPVLVDTSAWVEFFRDTDSPISGVVDRLLEEELVVTTGVIRAELLQGTRSEREFDELAVLLAALPELDEPSRLWDEVARLGFRLRRAGLSVGIPDIVIAVTARESGSRLLTLDRHFERIASVIPLKLLT